jgi:hypothetical protein
MRKSFITRLERLEALNEAKRHDLSGLSDEELDARILDLSRKMGHEGPAEDCYAWDESTLAELRADIQREVEAGKAETKRGPRT